VTQTEASGDAAEDVTQTEASADNAAPAASKDAAGDDSPQTSEDVTEISAPDSAAQRGTAEES